MAEFDLQQMLSKLDEKVTEARDAGIRLEARFDAFEARHSDHERAIRELRGDVDALASSKAEADAVARYRSEARITRLWAIGCAAGCVGTMVSVATFILLHA